MSLQQLILDSIQDLRQLVYASLDDPENEKLYLLMIRAQREFVFALYELKHRGFKSLA